MKLPLKLSNNDTYYSSLKVFSYDFYMALIDGGRGIGKTTTFLLACLKQCEKGKQFIYMRRYPNELTEFIDKDTLGKLIDGIVYKRHKTGSITVYWEKYILGYLIPLSRQRQFKSANFENVSMLFFDEGIVKQTATYRYLNNEVENYFLEFVSTIERTRPKGSLKIIICGNNEDLFNPYAQYFNLPLFENRYYNIEQGLYAEHAKNSPKLLALEEKTGLYALTKNTNYHNYHYKNEYINAKTVSIIPKPKQPKLYFRLLVNGKTLNIYTHYIGTQPRLFIEMKDKFINDDIAYELFNNGQPNYLYIQQYKTKFRVFMNRYIFNNRVDYATQQSADILYYIIEKIK